MQTLRTAQGVFLYVFCNWLLILFLGHPLSAQQSLETAVALTRQGHYAEARKLLHGIPEPSETSRRIAFHRLKAAIASGLGDIASAVDEMRSALRLSPLDPALLLATAVAETQAGQYDDALRHARQSGESATAEGLIGDIEDKRGDFQSSVKAYQSAIALAPAQEQYRIALGLELIQHQAFASAVEVLNQAASVFPKSGKIRALLGIAHYAYGDSADAITSLENAIAVEPRLDATYRCLSQIVLQSSAVPSQRSINLLCPWNKTVCAALKLRVAHAGNNRAMENTSIAELQQASHEDAVSQCELARGLEWTNQTAKARAPMERCVALDPAPQNHYRMALIYRKLGMTELARKELAARKRALQNMSEETALSLSNLRTLEHSLKAH